MLMGNMRKGVCIVTSKYPHTFMPHRKGGSNTHFVQPVQKRTSIWLRIVLILNITSTFPTYFYKQMIGWIYVGAFVATFLKVGTASASKMCCCSHASNLFCTLCRAAKRRAKPGATMEFVSHASYCGSGVSCRI